MTVWRWLRDEDLGFPEPLVINGRRFWLEGALDEFDDERTAKTSRSDNTADIPEPQPVEFSGQGGLPEGNAHPAPGCRVEEAGAGSDGGGGS